MTRVGLHTTRLEKALRAIVCHTNDPKERTAVIASATALVVAIAPARTLARKELYSPPGKREERCRRVFAAGWRCELTDSKLPEGEK